MNKPTRYFWVILLISINLCYAAAKKNIKPQESNTSTAKTKFNLNNLYAKNHYSTFADNDIIYIPDLVKARCPNIADKIISDVPPEQNPQLKPSDCNPNALDEMHTQMEGSCDPDSHGDFGKLIKSSVVTLVIPTIDDKVTRCSGTVIGQKWILSAAHCFTQENTNFYTALRFRPVSVNSEYLVKSIYIPYNYNLGNTISNDIAVLELKDPLPPNFKQVALSNEIPQNGSNRPVWSAGYGGDRKLSYRKQYFITNLYDSNWPHGILQSGNLNELYISGTVPTIDPTTHQYIAWTFMHYGDSGGPALVYNEINHKMELLGISSYLLGCAENAFLGIVPYNYAAYSSVPAYNNFIQNVMHKIKPNNYSRHLTLSDHPDKFNVFILSNTENSILHRYINEKDERKNITEKLETGKFPTSIGLAHKNIYVTNYMDNSISHYKAENNHSLYQFDNINAAKPDNPTDIKMFGNNYAVVTSYNKDKLYFFERNKLYNRMLTEYKEFETGIRPVSIATTFIDDNEYVFVANSGSKSISAYMFESKKIKVIDKDLKLKDNHTEPLKILAEKHSIIVQDTQGISLYEFDNSRIGQNKLKFKTFIPMSFDPKANSDFILLPSNISSNNSLLAISYGNFSMVKIYDIDFAASTIDYNTTLPVKGTGLDAYENYFSNQIKLHIINASTQRTVNVFTVYPQDTIKEKVRFKPEYDYMAIDNSSKIVIQDIN